MDCVMCDKPNTAVVRLDIDVVYDCVDVGHGQPCLCEEHLEEVAELLRLRDVNGNFGKNFTVPDLDQEVFE